jgi:hypothetical protein
MVPSVARKTTRITNSFASAIFKPGRDAFKEAGNSPAGLAGLAAISAVGCYSTVLSVKFLLLRTGPGGMLVIVGG